LDDGQNIRAVLLDVGGFLGLGERRVAVSPRSIRVVNDNDGPDHALINATKEHLTSAPEFKVQPRRAG
jgi:hypothetical protein